MNGGQARLTPAADATAARWIVEGVRDFDFTVGSIVPACFEAYARVFHPAGLGGDDHPEPVRWAQVAAANGRTMHPVVEWGSLTGGWGLSGQDGLWDQEPETGSLDSRFAAPLAAALAAHTATPERCWFAVWEGDSEGEVWLIFAEPGTAERARREGEERREQARRLRRAAARFTLPGRPMELYSAPLAAVADPDFLEPIRRGGSSPNLWWPEDRAWCVGSEIDLMTTYVGGTRACIEAILAEPALEALPASVDQRVTWDADMINPLPAPPGG